jgi:hypothetical protein
MVGKRTLGQSISPFAVLLCLQEVLALGPVATRSSRPLNAVDATLCSRGDLSRGERRDQP